MKLKKFNELNESKASDHKCSKKSCDKQADVFIQASDPDLSLNLPLCREHADDYKLKMMLAMYGEIGADDIDSWLKEQLNEYFRATGRNVGQREYQRQRQELLNSLVTRLNKASLEQLEQIKYILGW